MFAQILDVFVAICAHRLENMSLLDMLLAFVPKCFWKCLNGPKKSKNFQTFNVLYILVQNWNAGILHYLLSFYLGYGKTCYFFSKRDKMGLKVSEFLFL